MIKVLTVAVAVLLAALAGTGALLKNAYEDTGRVEALYDAQREETKRAVAQTTVLRVQHAVQAERYTALQRDRADDSIRYQRDLRRVESLRKTTERAALKHPEKFGRVATIRFRRGLRDVCRAGGGSPAACKISVPKPPKAAAGPANQSAPQDDDGVAGGSTGRGGQGVRAGVHDAQRQP